MQNRLNIRILHIALLFLLSAGCLLPHAAYATPLQDDLIAIRTAMQAELASDRDYGEMNRQAKTFEERLAILRLQQAEAESIVRHLRQIKMHSKEGRVIRDKMAGSFEKISNIMTVGITVKPEDIPAFSTMAENMKTASRETIAVMREYAELAEKHGVANDK